MKKETFNLVLRALIGVAAALIIVGAMGLITEAQANKTIMEKASGLEGTETVMTVDGEAVTAEEYLFMAASAAQELSYYYGITDLGTDLGDGVTAADHVAKMAKEQVIAGAVLRAWAREQGVALTEEDMAALQAQKDAYGGEEGFRQWLSIMGIREELFDSLMAQDMLYSHLYEIYCAEGGAQRPSDADLEALAEEHKLVSAYLLAMKAGDEGAKEKMEDYAARLAEAENKVETVQTFAAELGNSVEMQTIDCCHESPVRSALLALEVNEVSGPVEEDEVIFVILRTDLDLTAAASVRYNEMYNLRVSEAAVEENESVLGKIDVADFFAKYVQMQQNAYTAMMQG